MSFDDALAYRLEFLANDLGREDAVALTGKSWRQLYRYFAGAEPPVGVIVGLALGAKVTTDYVIHGIPTTIGDYAVAEAIVEQELSRVRVLIDEASADELTELEMERDALLRKIDTLRARSIVHAVDDPAIDTTSFDRDLLQDVVGQVIASERGESRDQTRDIARTIVTVYELMRRRVVPSDSKAAVKAEPVPSKRARRRR